MYCGDARVITKLLNHPRFTSIESQYLEDAAGRGNIEILRVMLRDERFDVRKYGPRAIKAAVERGHTTVVRELADDCRIEISRRLQKKILNSLWD